LGNDSALALSTGDVGIGTTSLLSASGFRTLTMNGSNASLIELQGGGTSYARIQGNSSEFAILARGNTPMVFYTNPSASDTERMRITSAGNVGIGTSSPNYSLQVNSATTTTRLQITNTTTGTGASSGLQIIQDGVNTTLSQKPNGFMSFETNNAERFRITANGVTFNGDTAAANALDDYEEGTWTPVDGSGGGLTYVQASGNYTKVGREVFVRGFVNFPATADVNQAIIAGLPFTTSASLSGREGNISYVDKTAISYILSNLSTTTFSCWNSAGATVTNAQMSGAFFYFSLNYNV
jgi:hypothetical protein